MIYRRTAQVILAGLLLISFSACKQKEEIPAEVSEKPSVEGGSQGNGGAAGSGALPVLSALPDFSLTDENEKIFGSKDLRGKVWVADFIFTRCASTCPMQTAEKVKLQSQFKDAEDLRLVTFTVDPENDTPAVLAEYGAKNGVIPGRWKFLTGKRGDL